MNSGPILSIGSAGPDVRRLQIIFVMTKVLDVSDIDSQFGPKTQDAVKSFQQGNNLTPDGVVGPLTWQALPADPNTPRLARGSTGPAVSALQKGLKAFDGPNTPTDPGQIDGNFGQRTEISRACLSNSAKHRSRRSCWRPDLVGSCRCSWGHAGKISWPRHCVISWRQPERLNRQENLSTSQSQQKAAPVHVQYTRPVASRTERQPRTSYTDP